jgi:DUF4097 and DUF4098 domain-containing protein YvlB
LAEGPQFKLATLYGIAATAALGLLLPLAAVGGQTHVHREGNQWIEESNGEMAATASVVVGLPQGDLVITGSDQPKIAYQLKKRAHSQTEADARREFQGLRLSAHRVKNTTYVLAQYERDSLPRCAQLAVTVPRSTKFIRLVSDGGTQKLAGIDGKAEIHLGGGRLQVDQLGGSLQAKVGMGSVEIGSLGGDLMLRTGGAKVRIGSVRGRITVQSGGGDIFIDSASQAVTAHTDSGEIDVHHSGGELNATTGGGSLRVGWVAGRATLQTAAGNIHLGSAGGPVSASTAGGKIKLWGLTQAVEARITNGGPITAEFIGGAFHGSTLQTPTGDIIVYVSPKLRATVRATIDMANGHRLASQFAEVKTSMDGGRFGGPATIYAEGRLNGGGPVLRVRTTNGNIDIRRAKR